MPALTMRLDYLAGGFFFAQIDSHKLTLRNDKLTLLHDGIDVLKLRNSGVFINGWAVGVEF
ncbi:MAG: hypothetical protein ABTQ25_17985 [Nitrosomonas ureae]